MIELTEREIFDLCSRLGIIIVMNQRVSKFNKRLYYLDMKHTFMMVYDSSEDSYVYSFMYEGRETFNIQATSYTMLLNTYDRLIKDDGFIKNYEFWKEGLK